MNNLTSWDWDGFDVIPPKEPISITLELKPEEIELAFATEGESLRRKVLMALVISMISDHPILGADRRGHSCDLAKRD
jgi:hypothetical protein